MPHIVSTDKQFLTLQKGDAVERHKQQLLDYIRSEEEHTVYLDSSLDPTDSVKQLGNYMFSDVFEKRLATILPSRAFFVANPFRAGFRAVVLADPSSWCGYRSLSPYEGGILSEHTILEAVYKEVPDPDYISRKRALTRKDLPKSEYVKGQGFVFEEGTRPGFKKIRQAGRVYKKGWRHILVQLLMEGIISLADTERVFKRDDSATWAKSTRGADIKLPW